ncbi:Adenine-specific methyltransferase [hydrothermal vent metagenome]|uniref:Adenine-specific methyltransferase n=1 Tax=hydrothermal vent metagenome TaxID=652676 RepID=A0A3B0X3B7_9ZZZZ
MGRLDKLVLDKIQQCADDILPLLELNKESFKEQSRGLIPQFTTSPGSLYKSDFIDLLKTIDNDSVDLVFADPPFNLSKLYPSNINDNLKTEKYLHWCQQWLSECVRTLKPGGSLFLWNLAKWNASLAGYPESLLTFRNWISVDIKYSLAMQICPKCYGDIN